MLTDNFNSKAALQITRVIFFGLISGSIFFFLITLYLSAGHLVFKFDLRDPFTSIVIILTCTSIPIGYFYSQKVYKSYKPDSTPGEKYSLYQQGLIMRLAVFEGVGLFSIVCILISSNLFFTLFFSIALIAMIFNYPFSEKIGETLELTSSEIESFNY